MWNTKEFDFGNALEKTKLSCTFSWTGDKVIKKVQADCGCTIPKQVDNNIVVSYTIPEIPGHLTVLGKPYNDVKQVRVFFTDDTVDILKIKVRVCREL